MLKVYRFAVRGNLTIGAPAGTIGTITDPLGTRRVAESRFDVWLVEDGRVRRATPVHSRGGGDQPRVGTWTTSSAQLRRPSSHGSGGLGPVRIPSSRCRAKLSPLACRRVVVPGSSR